MRKDRRVPRVPTLSLPVKWVIGLTLLLVIAVVLVSALRKESFYQRTTIAVVGEEISVISWDRKNNSYLIISIPIDIRVDTIHGYGTYAVGALWKLDQLERFGSILFAGSLSDAIGIPIDGVLDAGEKNVWSEDPLTRVKQAFSIPLLIANGIRRQTTLSLPQSVDLWWGSHMRKIGSVDSVDINEQNLYSQINLPDGMSERSLNLSGLTLAIGTKLEDEAVRREALRVAVYNSTGESGLGAAVARMLSTIGMFVVVVGNDEQVIDQCQIITGKEFEKTQTFQLLQLLFHCQYTSRAEDGRADITIHLGAQSAARYKPRSR